MRFSELGEGEIHLGGAGSCTGLDSTAGSIPRVKLMSRVVGTRGALQKQKHAHTEEGGLLFGVQRGPGSGSDRAGESRAAERHSSFPPVSPAKPLPLPTGVQELIPSSPPPLCATTRRPSSSPSSPMAVAQSHSSLSPSPVKSLGSTSH